MTELNLLSFGGLRLDNKIYKKFCPLKCKVYLISIYEKAPIFNSNFCKH